MRALMAGLIGGVVVAIGGILPAAATYVDGLRYTADVTYELEPSAERVHVGGEVTVTNQMPNQGARYYYFDEIPVHVPTEAVGFSAHTPGGAALSTRVADEDGDWTVWLIRLPSDLLYQQTQRVRFDYELPNLPPRSEGWTRATPAAASFAAYGLGDPGLSSVTVVVPDEYSEVELGRTDLQRSLSGGAVHYTAEAIEDPDTWWLTVGARNDELLDSRDVSVGEHAFLLRYWPGDEEWADFAEEMLTTGIPVLEELIGRPWPVDGELQVIESSVPHALGYAGWFDSVNDVIEVGDQLDRATMLHELAHAWFNQRFTGERWFLEGTAELYSHLAIERLDAEIHEPEKPPASHPAVQPLAGWEQVPFDDADEFVYAMSWWILAELYAEIGADAMRATMGSIADREISYRSDLPAEVIASRLTWQRLLDLMVEAGGSELAEELFVEHVLDDDHVALLEDRNAARAVYAALLDDADEWTAPLELRQAMTLWEFEDVDELADAARDVLVHRDHVLGSVAPWGVTELPALAEAYHGAETVLDAMAVAESYVVVADELTAVQDPRAGVAGVLAKLGLLGADVDGRIAGAAALLGVGEVDAAAEQAASVAGEVDGAPLIGAVLAGQVVLAAALFWPLRRMTVRRRERGVYVHAIGSDAWPTDEPFSSPSVR